MMNNKEHVFNVLNDFFDHTYIITLKRNKDRHSLFKEALEGLNYEIFYGVDGRDSDLNELYEKDLYDPYLTRLLKKRKGRRIMDMDHTRIGCALSHIGVYQDMIEKGYKKVLVLEDDPLLDLSAVDVLSKALSELPDEWEFIYFGHWGANSNPSPMLKLQKSILVILAKIFQRYERLRQIDPNVIRCWFPRPYSKNLELAGSHHGTYAYGITKKGAEKILGYQVPVVQEHDNAIAELCSYEWLHAFSIKKHLFLPNRELPSTINISSK